MRFFCWLVGCLGLLTFLECRAVGLIQAANAPEQVDVVRGIITGHPYWKAYQNRLLGPGIVSGASQLTGVSLERCYEGFCFGAALLANATCFFLFLRGGRDRARAWLYTVAYAGLFVALQDTQWLYLWDYLDLTSMLLFAWPVVFGGRAPWRFAALFVLQLLNRESAEFIALWLVVDAVQLGRTAPGIRIDFRQGGIGVALGVAGMFWTRFVRNALCIQETGLVPRPEMHETASGQFWMPQVTLDLLREPPTVTSVTLLLFLGALVYLLARAWGSLGPRAWKVGLILGAQVAANLCLAFIFELRVWFTLLPWLLCLAHVRQVRETGGLSTHVE